MLSWEVSPSACTAGSLCQGHLDLLDPPLSGSSSLLKEGRIGLFTGSGLVDIPVYDVSPIAKGKCPAETNGFDGTSDFLPICFVLAIP